MDKKYEYKQTTESVTDIPERRNINTKKEQWVTNIPERSNINAKKEHKYKERTKAEWDEKVWDGMG